MASSTSRREALRSFAAVGLGLGLTRIGFDAASAAGKKKKLGTRCKKKAECAGGLQCKTSNSQNGCYAESEKRCCKPVGANCNDGCECCGVDVICNGGFCQKA
jgi:hypothetical protein